MTQLRIRATTFCLWKTFSWTDLQTMKTKKEKKKMTIIMTMKNWNWTMTRMIGPMQIWRTASSNYCYSCFCCKKTQGLEHHKFHSGPANKKFYNISVFHPRKKCPENKIIRQTFSVQN
ncbi:hypothetical protein M8J76_012513 [Diaphorina citri]|nr:hypothetical protein M8J75_012228 [Diaphorina citri]KAI5730334.1 hypothetical protein M8J76_012513 [Diaphorina citri]